MKYHQITPGDHERKCHVPVPHAYMSAPKNIKILPRKQNTCFAHELTSDYFTSCAPVARKCASASREATVSWDRARLCVCSPLERSASCEGSLFCAHCHAWKSHLTAGHLPTCNQWALRSTTFRVHTTFSKGNRYSYVCMAEERNLVHGNVLCHVWDSSKETFFSVVVTCNGVSV